MAEKNFAAQIWAILGPKYRFFGIFSETTIEILVINRQNVEDDSAEQTQKTAGLNLFKKSRYFPPCTIANISAYPTKTL